MIRVAFLCTSQARGGLEMNLIETANQLSNELEIFIITVEDSLIYEKAKLYNLNCVIINKPKKYFDLISAYKLSNIIEQNKIGHLLVFDNKDTDFCSLSKLFNKKFKLYYHQNMHIGGNKKDFFHTLRYKRFDIWISPLQILAKEVEELTNFPKNKIRKINIGVDDSAFSNKKSKLDAKKGLEIDSNIFVIGLIGRIDEQKGQMTALEAMSKIKDTNIVLLIVGEPTKDEGNIYRTKMINYIENNNLLDKVKIIGFSKNIQDIFSALDLFVLTSFSETYGLVTIEAMMAKVPIIATKRGGTSEITENGKYAELFSPRDSQELSEKILTVYNNYELFENRAQIAFDYAINNFTKKIEKQKLLDLFKEEEDD